MAEQYFLGTNRIYYRAGRFQEGLVVTAKFLDPKATWGGEVTMNEAGNGLYYLDLQMNIKGTWVGLFYENGERTISQNFYVIRSFKTGNGNLIGC